MIADTTDAQGAGPGGGIGGAAPSPGRQVLPAVRTIGFEDVRASLVEGLSDFARAPAFGLFFGTVVALCGLGIVAALAVFHKPWLIYPFAIGFPLLGPFLAVGLYEVSRRLESGKPLVWSEIIGVILAQRSRELVWMAFVMLFVFWFWMYQIRLLLAIFLGQMSFSSFAKFTELVLSTPQGFWFLAVGHVIGAVLAMTMFALTVVSIPILLDREIDFITAMITSVKAVVMNPAPMLGWGVFVTLAVIAASLPLFAGLLIVLPVLGHATWHLYRRLVVPA
jgi:uncharacterized membrane protein